MYSANYLNSQFLLCSAHHKKTEFIFGSSRGIWGEHLMGDWMGALGGKIDHAKCIFSECHGQNYSDFGGSEGGGLRVTK